MEKNSGNIFDAVDMQKWFNQPVEHPTQQNDSLSVTIKEGQFDVNKIIEYTGKIMRKFEFKPLKWDQFVGQEEAKERALTIIKKVHKGLKSHFLVDGIKGHGKTCFVELFAKDIDAHFIQRIGKQITIDNIVDIVNEINTSKKKNVVFFVDEIDTTDKDILKVLNPIIYNFNIAGKKIKPFIFVGATINKHILIENNPDTLDRIPTHIKFKRYNSIEILQILQQYITKLYSDENIEPGALIIIAKNCKYNPRTAIALLEEYIVEEDINKVIKNCNIIKNGLTKIDVKILEVLNESEKAIGSNALSQRCGISQKEYEREFEPYLCEYGYVNRVPSRIISEKGKELLNEINM